MKAIKKKEMNINTTCGKKAIKDFDYSAQTSNIKNDEASERDGLLSMLRLSWRRIFFWIATLLLSYPIAKVCFSDSIRLLMFSDIGFFMLYALLLIVLLLFDITKRSPMSFLLLSFSLLSYFGISASLICATDGAYFFYIFPALLLTLGYHIIFTSDEIGSIRLKRRVNYSMIKVLFVGTLLLQLVLVYINVQNNSDYSMTIVLTAWLCSIIIASLLIKDDKSLRIVSFVWYAMPLFFSICYFDDEVWKNLTRFVCLFWPLNTIVPVLGIVLSYNKPHVSN